MTSHLVRASIAGLLLLSIATPARADKCAAKKLKLIGKKEAGLLGCQAKVASSGDASALAACEAKVSAKFSSAFAKAGTCVGDVMVCENVADACEAAVGGALVDTLPSKCESAKRKAAGKLAKAEIGCYAKAAAKGIPVDAAGCIGKATDKFAVALVKAGTCSDGGSPRALVEDACVTPVATTDGNGVVTDVCPVTTTTSTTSSTTTITTTTTNTTTTSTTTTTTSTVPAHCDLSASPTPGTRIHRSDTLTLTGLLTCTGEDPNPWTFDWTFCADPVVLSTSSTLSLLPYSLDAGLPYCFVVTAIPPLGSTQMPVSFQVQIDVLRSTPSAVLLPASGDKPAGPLSLDASQSVDPDYPNDLSHLQFSWGCSGGPACADLIATTSGGSTVMYTLSLGDGEAYSIDLTVCTSVGGECSGPATQQYTGVGP